MSDTKIAGISFVERAGPGPCLVFLHGIGSNAGSFRALFDRLPSDFHLLAWNAPGYGASDPLAADWPVAADYATALLGLLRALGAGPVVLVGHSLGALVAAAFARAYPEHVAHLVLASCAAGYGVPVDGEMPASVAKRITDLDALGPAEFARTRAPRLVHRPEDHSEVVAAVADAMSRVTPHGYAQAVRMLASGDLYDTLRHVTVPCDFVTGAEDQVTPARQTFAAAEAWAAARGLTPRMESIPEAGHAVYIQRADAVAATLLRLVAAVAPTPKALIGDPND